MQLIDVDSQTAPQPAEAPLLTCSRQECIICMLCCLGHQRCTSVVVYLSAAMRACCGLYVYAWRSADLCWALEQHSTGLHTLPCSMSNHR